MMEDQKVEVTSVSDIEKVLYKQVELLAENSKNCEPKELIKITECIDLVYHHLMHEF